MDRFDETANDLLYAETRIGYRVNIREAEILGRAIASLLRIEVAKAEAKARWKTFLQIETKLYGIAGGLPNVAGYPETRDKQQQHVGVMMALQSVEAMHRAEIECDECGAQFSSRRAG